MHRHTFLLFGLLLAGTTLSAAAPGEAATAVSSRRPLQFDFDSCTSGCPDDYEPECGKNGKTYQNSCFRNCYDVDYGYGGVCKPKPCKCPFIWYPVCGRDSNIYVNECFMKCAGVKKAHHGYCSGTCVCTLEYAPVCGVDGTTYSNACQARCAGIPVAYTGRCKRSCGCKRHTFKPVCAFGKTYPSACVASCYGVKKYKRGSCKLWFPPSRNCSCSYEYSPVCDTNNFTWMSKCWLDCSSSSGDFGDFGACSGFEK